MIFGIYLFLNAFATDRNKRFDSCLSLFKTSRSSITQTIFEFRERYSLLFITHQPVALFKTRKNLPGFT